MVVVVVKVLPTIIVYSLVYLVSNPFFASSSLLVGSPATLYYQGITHTSSSELQLHHHPFDPRTHSTIGAGRPDPPTMMGWAAAADQQQQPPAPVFASLSFGVTPKKKQYGGTWTDEEEVYANYVIQLFKEGLLSDTVPEGGSLRAFLSIKLSCSPKRISKKF